ncbi:MAG TPA: hypothetical protein VHR66_16710 [Gemmataceae bacterium]|nr:hypothetical protein [Gemmataceae bacterium]
MKEAVSLYNEGVYTVSGFVCFVCKLAASDEIEEFVNTCPANLLAALNESLANYGEDENTWPRTFHSGCYAPWTTPEEIEESSRKRQQQIWDGVRILKKKLSERK